MRLLIIGIYLLFHLSVCSQQINDSIQLVFNASFQNKPISLGDNKTYHLNSSSLTLENLKYYVGNIQLIYDNQVIWQDDNSFHLIDHSTQESCQLDLPSFQNIDQVRFLLGIDSLTNTSGVFGGDLDPTNGMYWTWQSGYINFKLEGTSPLSKTRGNKFQYHLGGYAAPYPTALWIELPYHQKDNKVQVNFLIDEFIQELNIGENPTIMSPGEKAQLASQIAARLFKIHE